MILTLLGNRRRILDAAQKAAAQARQEECQQIRQEVRQEARQEVADWWYGYAKAEFAAGRDPGPPPILNETGNSNNRAPY